MNNVRKPPLSEPAPPPDEQRPSARAWLAVASVALGAFIIVTTEFIPVGLLPRIADSLHVSLGLAGLMIVVPGLSAAVSAPLIFAGARRVDRRKLILTLGGLVALSNAVAAIAPDFGVVLLGRALLGAVIAGFWTVVTPVGPKLVGARAGTRAISFIVAGVSAGTVIGLPAGQALGNLLGWRLTFATAAATGLVIVAVQLVLLPGIAVDGRTRLRDLGGVFRIPSARAGLIATAIVFIGQFAASTYITPLLTEHARMGTSMVTALFFGYGAAGIIGTLIGGRLVARSRVGTFAGAALTVGAALIALPELGTTHLAVGIIIVAWGLIWGLIPLAAQVWMLRSDPEAQEAVSAANVSNMQISIAVGSAVGGLLIDSAGLVTVYTVAGSIALASAVFALITGRRGPVSGRTGTATENRPQ
jgi:predicted MFS family arabinose efflux permease